MITTFFAPRAIRNRRLPGRYAWQRPTRVCALLLAALALLPHFPAPAQAPKAAPNVPAVWSDVDKTLSYEIALAAALRGGQQAPPLREAQRQIAAEGAPTSRHLMALLQDDAWRNAVAFKMGACEHAALLVRLMLLRAAEATAAGAPAADAAPPPALADMFAEHMGRCERLRKRPPTPRLIGTE